MCRLGMKNLIIFYLSFLSFVSIAKTETDLNNTQSVTYNVDLKLEQKNLQQIVFNFFNKDDFKNFIKIIKTFSGKIKTINQSSLQQKFKIVFEFEKFVSFNDVFKLLKSKNINYICEEPYSDINILSFEARSLELYKKFITKFPKNKKVFERKHCPIPVNCIFSIRYYECKFQVYVIRIDYVYNNLKSYYTFALPEEKANVIYFLKNNIKIDKVDKMLDL